MILPAYFLEEHTNLPRHYYHYLKSGSWLPFIFNFLRRTFQKLKNAQADKNTVFKYSIIPWTESNWEGMPKGFVFWFLAFLAFPTDTVTKDHDIPGDESPSHNILVCFFFKELICYGYMEVETLRECRHKHLHLLAKVQTASSSFCCAKQMLVFSTLNLGESDNPLEAQLASVGKITILIYICVIFNDFHRYYLIKSR